MTHGELRVLFLKYHQNIWPERRCFSNNTGWARFKFKGVIQFIPYGLPAPKRGRLKKAGGGGPDLLSIGNEDGYHTVWYFELKTKKDSLKPNQKRFAEWALSAGAKYWIVKEDDSDRGFRLIRL